MTAPSSELASLLRAAQKDAPSAAAKQRIFTKVAAKTAVTAGAAPLAWKLFGSLGAKLAFGASLAAALGLAAYLYPWLTAPPLAPDVDDVTTSHERADGVSPGPASFVTLTSVAPASPEAKVVAAPTSDVDAIEREARWVAEARTALMRGEPASAASKARAARALPSHLLEPEELRILGRALRVMGDDREADAVFAELVAKYPEEALRP